MRKCPNIYIIKERYEITFFLFEASFLIDFEYIFIMLMYV